MHILEQLIQNNEYPIVFIGSGISKRYLNDFPAWEDLLEEYWELIGEDIPFYGHLSILAKELKELFPESNDDHIEYLTNIKVAQYISMKFDELFVAGKISVEGLDFKSYYKNKLSAFKESLAQRFIAYEVKEEMNEEILLFRELLKKSQILVTTNYDNFIEDQYSKDSSDILSTYIGNTGFFNDSEGWAELYKIHGGIEAPNSIVITEDDYQRYNQNKILISAKLTSAMINSPIIFLGYSLKDENVQNLISDFASQLPSEDIRKSAQRIIVVEWESGQDAIVEHQIQELRYGWNYTLLKTDNFSSLYEKLTKINQGLSPLHVRKYNQVIKKLIVEKGRKGAMDSVLLSPDELSKIEEKINAGKPIVVALGDQATIFMMPNIKSYLEDYILGKNEIVPEVALRFVADHSPKARIPFAKHLKAVDLDKTNLLIAEKNKIRERVVRSGKLESCLESINKSHQIEVASIDEAKELNYKQSKEIDVIVYNIEKLKGNEVKSYLEDIVRNTLKDADGSVMTPIRRLATAYDLLIHGDLA